MKERAWILEFSHLSGYLTSELSVHGEKGRASRYWAGDVGLSGQEGGWEPLRFLGRVKFDIILMSLEWGMIYFAISPDDSV